MKKCNSCSKFFEDSCNFCNSCGKKVKTACEDTESSAVIVKENPKKKAVIIVSVLAFVAVVVGVALFFIFGKDKLIEDYMIYVKDSKYNHLNFENNKSFAFGKIDSDSIAPVMDLNALKRTANGSTVFYLTRDNLYSKNIFNEKQEQELLAEDVVKFYLGNEYIFFISEENELFQFNIEQKTTELIASKVEEVYLVDTNDSIVYKSSSDELFEKTYGQQVQLVSSNVTDFYGVQSKYYYISEYTLFSKILNSEPVLIDKFVKEIVKVYETGEIYYVKNIKTRLTLYDLTVDDYLEADQVEINLNDHWYEYSEDTFDPVAYENQQKDLMAVMDELLKRDVRNALRRLLKKTSATPYVYNLFYYDNTNSICIAEGVKLIDDFACGKIDKTNSQAIYFETEKERIEGELVLSEMFDIYMQFANDKRYKYGLNESDVMEFYRQPFEVVVENTNIPQFNIAVKGNAMQIADRAYECAVNTDGSEVYLLNELDFLNIGKVYKCKIVDGVLSEKQLVAEEILKGDWRLTNGENTKLVSVTPNKENSRVGKLYIDGEKVDNNVWADQVQFLNGDTCIAYLSDYNTNKKLGTFTIYENGDATEIAHNVHAFALLSNDKIVYLSNFSDKRGKGDLYVYDITTKTSKKIDENVQSFMVPLEDE